MASSHRVVSEQTSESMRYLMRSNATHGSAGFANIEGYYVGGKTGTAQKIVGRHYSNDQVFTTFMAMTPADKPQYLYLVIYDQPQVVLLVWFGDFVLVISPRKFELTIRLRAAVLVVMRLCSPVCERT